jgi:hypothetical protein
MSRLLVILFVVLGLVFGPLSAQTQTKKAAATKETRILPKGVKEPTRAEAKKKDEALKAKLATEKPKKISTEKPNKAAAEKTTKKTLTPAVQKPDLKKAVEKTKKK